MSTKLENIYAFYYCSKLDRIFIITANEKKLKKKLFECQCKIIFLRRKNCQFIKKFPEKCYMFYFK